MTAVEQENNDLRAMLQTLIDHTLRCELELDRFHGLGTDAGSGCSEVVCNAQSLLRATE
jgi:hypothetical protein